jgi:hypothetical protein
LRRRRAPRPRTPPRARRRPTDGAADVEGFGAVVVRCGFAAELALEAAGEVTEDRACDVLHEVAAELGLAAGDLQVGFDDDVGAIAAGCEARRDRGGGAALTAGLAAFDAVRRDPLVLVDVL